ncbi:MAG: hypothetical protein WKF93_04055 [Acidimicrobiales bacterium]
MAGKFQIRSRKWDVGVLVGSLVVLALGFGGLFLLQGSASSSGTTTLWFVAVLGVITFALFAGPGIVYVLRKRVKRIKAALPGGTMAWIRAHLYLPIVALVAAFVHAFVVPFRDQLTSGKVLLVLGILVSVAGVARHHLIGMQKSALNVNVAIGKLTTGQPRAFRRLIADFTDARRPVAEIDAAMTDFEPALQERWAKIKSISTDVEEHFPRAGGQSWQIRQYKLWKALHPPLTIALFVVLGFHVYDVLGGTKATGGEEATFAAASSASCGTCHADIFGDWATSTMSHAQTSTITEAQLPVTLSENVRIAEEFGDRLEAELGRPQDDFVEANAAICINCHAQVGARFVDDPLALLPFGDEGSAALGDDGAAVGDGSDAIQSDGVGCIVCHSQEHAPTELAGGAIGARNGLTVDPGGTLDYGTVFGPPFVDPNPLPVRVHETASPEDSIWLDSLETSQLCGACHNVKLDIDDDGIIGVEDADEQEIVDIIDEIDDDPTSLDEDGDFQLDENELDFGDDGELDDLVLQTTFDEWQDYVAFFDVPGGFTDRYADEALPNDLNRPLGCNECHMPIEGDGLAPVVDYAPGALALPDRFNRQHTFVGVDYDLDPGLYEGKGLPTGTMARVLAERDALLQSSVTLEVTTGDVVDDPATGPNVEATVVVTNNLLAHAFPTGFAFARQAWLEVSAETADGEPVCLAPALFLVDGTSITNQPCGSGFADVEGTEPVEGADELPQCATDDVLAAINAATGEDFDLEETRDAGGAVGDSGVVIPNLDITFSPGAAFPAAECDPWLANFQKILTDADPDGDGFRTEVPYQPLLSDAVQIRGRVVDGSAMTELQPVRQRDVDGELLDDQSRELLYRFVLPDGVDASEVEVTARMRFRHLPPYFVEGLEEFQGELGDDVPEGARIDAGELLDFMVVSEMGAASSTDDGPQLACEGPQNEALSILECIDDDDLADAAERLGVEAPAGIETAAAPMTGAADGAAEVAAAHGGQAPAGAATARSGLAPEPGLLALFGTVALAFVVPVAGLRRASSTPDRRRRR